MNTRASILFVLFFFITAIPTTAQSFGDIVVEKNFEAAEKIVRKVIDTAGLSLSLGVPQLAPVEPGSKPAGRFIITYEPLTVVRMTGCVVFTAAPVKTDAYISHSLIISTAPIQSGSYVTNSGLVSTQGINIGSYSSGNVIQAESVSVGSSSSNTKYYNVEPSLGKGSEGDEFVTSNSITEILGF